MVESETIEGIFRNLDGYVDQLRLLSALPQEIFVVDPIRLGAAKYYLQVAVECCIDVTNHIIAHQGFRAPETYPDSFTVLAENDIIEPARDSPVHGASFCSQASLSPGGLPTFGIYSPLLSWIASAATTKTAAKR